jgi:hypothetical protein
VLEYGIILSNMKKSWNFLTIHWRSLPRWFRIIFTAISIFYACAWIVSIYLSISYGQNVSIPVLSKDSAEYGALAESLRHHGTFSLIQGIPETFRTPGYPLFVMIFGLLDGGTFFAATFVQIILMLVGALLVQDIGRRFFSPHIGAVAATAFLLNPTTLAVSLFIFSDSLFAFLYILFFWLTITRLRTQLVQTIILMSIITTAALYVRPMGVLAFPIFLAPLLLSSISWKKMIIVAISLAGMTALLVTPWMERNRQHTGVFLFSTLAPYNISVYNIPMYYAHKNGTSPQIETARLAEEIGLSHSLWKEPQSAPILKKSISHFVREHVFGYAVYHSITSLPFFFGSDIEWSLRVYFGSLHIPFTSGGGAIFDLAKGDIGTFFSKITSQWWKFTERLWICFLGLSCLYSLVIMRKKPAVWVWAGIILYLAFLAGPVSDARYRFPTDAFIYLLASSGFVSFLDSRSRSTPSRNRRFLYRI